ncbi:MAG: hypothetical protein H7Y20_12135 [Bryobacteraceae bacterium]|nr:hypothetical protein [Bryobacteraceae bacterium]
MPTVNAKAALAKVYDKTAEKIRRGEIPTTFIDAGQVLYRSINPQSPYTYLPKPAPGGHVSKGLANKLLIPGDGMLDLKNRFSGPSFNPSILPASGLYCVLQQQALVNESAHYSGRAAVWALVSRCVLRMRVMGRLLVADLSPHNPGALRFFRELGNDTWDRVNDDKDCSVARGIGLAVAHSGFLQGMCVQTVRESDRSDEERGDNLVLFAPAGRPVAAVYIEGAYYYGKTAEPEVFSVDFP